VPDLERHARPPDPTALRALTHPLRWKLIDLLVSEATVTVTRCAQVLGESTASCSYHLGMLAKYGYIEPVPGQHGRERPWRLANPEETLSVSSAELDTEGAMASEAVAEAFLDHQVAWLKDRLRRRDLEPAEWHPVEQLVAETAWLTAEEMKRVRGQLVEIMVSHAHRAGNPASRPEGAREVRLFLATTVTPRLPPKREP
jgi:hypothetical protein